MHQLHFLVCDTRGPPYIKFLGSLPPWMNSDPCVGATLVAQDGGWRGQGWTETQIGLCGGPEVCSHALGAEATCPGAFFSHAEVRPVLLSLPEPNSLPSGRIPTHTAQLI